MKSWFKILILICVLFSLNATAQQPPWEGKFIAEDKAMHFTFSAAFTMLGVEVAKDYKAKNPELIGITAGFSIGLAKEFLYDKNQSSRDLFVDFAGCVTGVYVNRWINKRIEKAYKKKGW